MLDPNHQLNANALLDILALSENATAIYTTEDIVIQMANDAMIAFWGRDRKVIGLPLEEAVPELKGQPFLEILRNVWNTGVTYEAKNTPAQLFASGELKTFYFDFKYRAILNTDHSTYCILHTATDVTERFFVQKLVQEQQEREQQLNEEIAASHEELLATNEELKRSYSKLIESENRSSAILNQAPIGISVLRGAELTVELANQAILNIWGRTRDEVVGKPHHAARPETEGQPINEWLNTVFETGIPKVNTEIRVLLHSGDGLREAYVNSTYQPLRDGEENIVGVLVILEEITERIKIRKEAERVQQMFNLAVESAELGTWYMDIVHRKLIPSPRLNELFGYHADEKMSFQDAINQIHIEHRDRVVDAINNAITHVESYDLEYPIVGYHDQKLRWVRATGKLYQANDGHPANFSGTILDITERKLDENRKNDFIAMVSHELKTPLTSIKAYVQMLSVKAKKLNDSFIPGALDKVDLQINKMQTLIKGFLDVARIESGKIQLNFQSFLIKDLLTEVVDETLLFSQSHEIAIKAGCDFEVEADRDKIGQVINNFLSNAIKYSPKGKQIELICERLENQLKVSIKDEGMGVRPEDRSRLFDRFYRVESKHTKTIAGFGIGLYLCAEIIQRHKGTIGVDSEAGQGSTFWFMLPLQQHL